MTRLAAAGVVAALALSAVLDLVAAGGTGPAILLPFAVAAAALAVTVRRDRLPPTRFTAGGLTAASGSLLLTVCARLGNPGVAAPWSLLETAALVLLLGVLARGWTRPRDTVALAGLGAALVCCPWRLVGTDAATFSLLVALLTTAVLAVGLLRRADDLRAAQAVLTARDAERRDIARDLHDDVAHHVTGIIVTAQATLATSTDAASARTALAAIERASTHALESMRDLVTVLRAPETDNNAPTTTPWPADLHDTVNRFARDTGLTTALTVAPGQVPIIHQQAVLRIVQEALTNIRRHAHGATRADVTLTLGPSAVRVVVTDDGHGNPDDGRPFRAGGGFGLVGVRERAAALGGHANAQPGPSGWRVDASLPLTFRRVHRDHRDDT